MDISPINISPLSASRSSGTVTLQSIINKYSTLRLGFSAENTTDVGTTITAIDYAGANNIANPSAASEPAIVTTYFNSNPSFKWDGSDYLIKNVANFGAGQTSGTFVFVFRTPSSFAANEMIFGVSDAATNLAKLMIFISTSGKLGFLVNNGALNVYVENDMVLSVNTEYIGTIDSNGSLIGIAINKTNTSTTDVVGINAGEWLSYANTGSKLDNISLGARINTSPQYSNGHLCCLLYYSYLSPTDKGNLTDDLTGLLL